MRRAENFLPFASLRMDLESNDQFVKPVESTDQSVQDARDLAALGHDQALSRKFDMWSMFALAFCVLGMHLPSAFLWYVTR